MTNHSPSHDFGAFNPDEYLISEEFRWQEVIETTSETFCMSVPRRRMDRFTGVYISTPVPCGTYACQRCAERKVRLRLTVQHWRLRRESECYIAILGTGDLAKNLIARRRYAMEEKLGRTIWYVRVDRDDGMTFLFANAALGGRMPPVTFYSIDNALGHFGHAMALPGVVKILGSHASSERHDDPNDDLFDFGFIGDKGFAVVNRIAADIAYERHGVTVNPLTPTELDRGLRPELWAECIFEAIRRRRAMFST